MAEQQVLLMIAGLFLLVGIIFALTPILIAKSRKKKSLMCDQKTTATVIQYLCLQADSGHTYAPVYSYYVNGIEYQKTSVYSSTGRRFSVGDKVVLSYCSANPEIYYVEEEQSIIKFVSVILGIISAVMIIVSVCLAIGSIIV